jgi:hypothetical protein
MSLAEATREFEKHWSLYASGKNPATVKEDELAALEAAPTVRMLGADYINRHAKLHKKSWLEDQRILEKDVYPIWGNRKAADITNVMLINFWTVCLTEELLALPTIRLR